MIMRIGFWTLPKGYKWEMTEAKKNASRGRAKGGMIVGIKMNREIGVMEVVEEREGLIWVSYQQGRHQLEIGVVYINKNWEEIRDRLDEMSNEGKRCVIGGDFNARMGEMPGGVNDQGELIQRISEDKHLNSEGRKLGKWVVEEGWELLNGCTEGDWEGKKTHIGHQCASVIDYVIIKEMKRREVITFEVEEVLGSDHLPIMVEIRQKKW